MAMGLVGEARTAIERTIELEAAADDDDTFATESLAALERGDLLPGLDD